MRIKASTSELRRAFTACAKAVATKPSDLILGYVLLKTADGAIELTASDLNITVRTGMIASIEEAGETCLPFQLVSEIIKNMGDEEAVIETVSSSQGLMTWSSGKTSLPLASADDYPQIAGPAEPAVRMTFPSGSLAEAISQVSTCIMTDETKPVFSSVYINADGTGIEAVGTDGKCVILKGVSKESQASPVGAMISKAHASALKSLLPKDGDVAFATDGKYADIILNDGTRITLRLMSSKYPNYRSIIPPLGATPASVNRELLLAALRRELAVADLNNLVCIEFVNGGTIRMTSKNTAWNIDAEETLGGKYEGPDHVVYFNGKRLEEVIGIIADETVEFHLGSINRPVLVTAADKDKGSATALISPSRPAKA